LQSRRFDARPCVQCITSVKFGPPALEARAITLPGQARLIDGKAAYLARASMNTPEAREVSGSGLRHVETVEADGPSGRKLA